MALSENQEEILVINWWNEHCKDYNLPEIALAHVRNEEPSAQKRAFNAKMGVRSGFPDLILTVPRGYYHGLFLELKRESVYSKRNPLAGLSENQINFKDFLNSQGYLSVVCYGHHDAIKTLQIYLNRSSHKDL